MRLSEICGMAGWQLRRDAEIVSLGFIDIALDGRLVYADSQASARAALAGEGIAAVLTTAALAGEAAHARLGLAVAPDPKRAFADLHNRLAAETAFYGACPPTSIAESANVHAGAHVDARGVVVGPGCRIDAGAVIGEGTELGAGVRVMSGAVLGGEGFQVMKFADALLDVRHAGSLKIGERCVIMANAVVARAVFRQRTEIGPDCRVGNGAVVSHNCRIGARCLIGHGTVLAGNCRVGADVTIGPGVICRDRIRIGDGAKLSLGAVVIGDVADHERVSGNFAVAHAKLKRLLAGLS